MKLTIENARNLKPSMTLLFSEPFSGPSTARKITSVIPTADAIEIVLDDKSIRFVEYDHNVVVIE